MPNLGDLERAVMEVLWAADEPLTVRDVLEALHQRELAYTTVLTVLDRLAKKDVAGRVREGKAWLYAAERSREQIAAGATAAALRTPGIDVGRWAEAVAAELTPAELRQVREALRALP